MATSRRNAKQKPLYEFTLITGRKPRLTVKAANALYEAGCDDALIGSVDGIGRLIFGREADSCRDALLSAIENVEGAGIGARIERIEPYDGQHADMIAALNAVLELRRQVPEAVEAQELVGALLPLWNQTHATRDDGHRPIRGAHV